MNDRPRIANYRFLDLEMSLESPRWKSVHPDVAGSDVKIGLGFGFRFRPGAGMVLCRSDSIMSSLSLRRHHNGWSIIVSSGPRINE